MKMKVSKKMKILSIIGIVSIGVVAIACANLNKSSTATGVNITPQTTTKWQKKAPQLFSNIGYSKLIESGVLLNKGVSESQAKLIGTVTNPFGIRDDILNYILTSIPESNVGARISATKRAQIDQQELFVSNPDELNKLADKGGAAIACLNTYLGGVNTEDFLHEYDNLQRNTPIRKAKQEEIEQKLGGHIISGNFGFWYTAHDSYESICARYIK